MPANSATADRPLLVAKPFTIEVKPQIVHVDPADKQWSANIVNAGAPVQGCVLEVIDSPISHGKGELVVSLVCEELPEGDKGKPVKRPEMKDYRVLVRDYLGRAVAPTPGFPRTDRAEVGKRFEKDTSVYLHRGDAMGAIIPLKEYFNLTKPGEYWALVSLPSGTAGKPDWVSEPVKVQVDAELPAPKK
jgi:hypothetical protein